MFYYALSEGDFYFFPPLANLNNSSRYNNERIRFSKTLFTRKSVLNSRISPRHDISRLIIKSENEKRREAHEKERKKCLNLNFMLVF